jgi:hypothetical protein
MKLIDRILLWCGLKRVTKPEHRKKRVCCLCLAQIKRAHRWHYGPTGEPQHWFCEIPTTVPLDMQKLKCAIPDAEPIDMVMP